MKTKHLILLVIILILLSVVILIGPFSPLNKSSVDGITFKIPLGYTVQETTGARTISNGTNTMQIYPTNDNTNLDESTSNFKNTFNETYNTTITDISTNKQQIKKTVSLKEDSGKTSTMIKIWFIKNNKIYNIQYYNDSPKIEKTAKEIISSMN